jgi:hypothetical protein
MELGVSRYAYLVLQQINAIDATISAVMLDPCWFFQAFNAGF